VGERRKEVGAGEGGKKEGERSVRKPR